MGFQQPASICRIIERIEFTLPYIKIWLSKVTNIIQSLAIHLTKARPL